MRMYAQHPDSYTGLDVHAGKCPMPAPDVTGRAPQSQQCVSVCLMLVTLIMD